MRTMKMLPSLRVAALAFAVSFPAGLAAQGLTYDLRTTGTGVDPRTGAETTRTFMAGHGQFATGLSRIDVTESMSRGGMMGAGTYTITNSVKGTTTIVDPAKRQYLELNPAEMAKTAAGLQELTGGMAKTEISNVSIGVEDLGAGEKIEGYPTFKYRITQSYTMAMTILGHTTRVVDHSTTEIWVAPELDGAMNPTARPSAAAATGPMAALTAELTKAYAKVRKGVLLKRVATSESATDGKTHTQTIAMTIANVKRGPVNPSAFDVPAGYTKVASFVDALGPMTGIGDSLRAHRAGRRPRS